MKSLQRVQKIFKVLYILTQIFFVISIIGVIGSIVASIFVGVWGNNPDVINSFASAGIKIEINQSLSFWICSIVDTLFLVIVLFFVRRFYKLELKQGNPFDKPVVSYMRKLGVWHIILPIFACLITAIITACFGVNDFRLYSLSNVILGIVYLIVSYVFEYGSELRRR